jgi:hypothetical protein
MLSGIAKHVTDEAQQVARMEIQAYVHRLELSSRVIEGIPECKMCEQPCRQGVRFYALFACGSVVCGECVKGQPASSYHALSYFYSNNKHLNEYTFPTSPTNPYWHEDDPSRCRYFIFSYVLSELASGYTVSQLTDSLMAFNAIKGLDACKGLAENVVKYALNKAGLDAMRDSFDEIFKLETNLASFIPQCIYCSKNLNKNIRCYASTSTGAVVCNECIRLYKGQYHELSF